MKYQNLVLILDALYKMSLAKILYTKPKWNPYQRDDCLNNIKDEKLQKFILDDIDAVTSTFTNSN